MSDPIIYRIPAINFPALEEAIVKMNRRARKLGCNEIVVTVLRDIVQKRKDDNLGFEYDHVIRECTVQGEVPKLKGWKFIATVEPIADTGENVIREMPGEKCPESYRTTDLHCDQCNSERHRKSVYVLRHDKDGYKQVGRQCLSDFLGGTSPDSMMAGAELMMDVNSLFKEASEDDWGRCGIPVISIHHYVSVVAVVIKKLGWVPKSQAEENKPATALIAYEICVNPQGARKLVEKYQLVVTDEEVKLAEQAIKWASEIDTNESNNYLYDLGVCCRSKFVTSRTIGFVASCIAAYQRHLSADLSKKMMNADGNYVGIVGQRQMFHDLTVTGIHPSTSTMYPSTWIHFADKDGNVLAWKASGQPEWPKLGLVVTVTATVEKHGEYNSVRQTMLKRVTPHEQPVTT